VSHQMSLTEIATENLSLIERGSYKSPSGNTVSIAADVTRAIEGTLLYQPSEFDTLAPSPEGGRPAISVTSETTAQAARRLVEGEGIGHVVALNFASAKNPGGGYLRGAKAQEEDLSRASALYNCQVPHRAYYDENRAAPSLIYTDHLIYSPAVPFFRDDDMNLLERPFLVSIITSPAPNAGEELRRDPNSRGEISTALRRRAAQVLAVAAHHKHRVLVLGAWGCGVFRNDPQEVAGVFADLLADPRFAGSFERVVFAVYDRTPDRATLRSFRERFEP
jgi:uncharacterized protein (TIGR02452 family)